MKKRQNNGCEEEEKKDEDAGYLLAEMVCQRKKINES